MSLAGDWREYDAWVAAQQEGRPFNSAQSYEKKIGKRNSGRKSAYLQSFLPYRLKSGEWLDDISDVGRFLGVDPSTIRRRIKTKGELFVMNDIYFRDS